MQMRKDIGPAVLAPAEAALAWLNKDRGTNFRLTGLVDADAQAPARIGDESELGLVLCDVDICAREQVRVVKTVGGFDIRAVEIDDNLIPVLLDPPLGVRARWLDDQLAKFYFVLLLFYRGRWCPPAAPSCGAMLKLGLDEIRAAGGEVFAITSEPQSLATEAEEDWNIGFRAVGDPHHETRETSRDRDLIDIYFNENYGHLRNRPWASYPKAYYQPGVLALSQHGRVIYRWRCRSTRDNMSGAGVRPTPAYSWYAMRARLSDAVEPALDESPEFGFKDFSWLGFLTIGLAHGWFVRPKMFPLGRPEDNASANQHKMM